MRLGDQRTWPPSWKLIIIIFSTTYFVRCDLEDKVSSLDFTRVHLAKFSATVSRCRQGHRRCFVLIGCGHRDLGRTVRELHFVRCERSRWFEREFGSRAVNGPSVINAGLVQTGAMLTL